MSLTPSKTKSSLAHKLEEVFGLDLRSLAVFRIGIAVVILVDLVMRWGDLKAHYSDQGILPRIGLINDILDPWYWSINLISGQTFVQGILFLVAFVLTILLLIGYRTRLVTIAVWVMILSIHNRNPLLTFAGDHVLKSILFWSMFLPLGAYYSMDHALNSSQKPLPTRIASGGTFAFILQVCYVYMWSAIYKHQHPLWQNGDAVYYSLNYDQYATPVGQLLAQLPNSLLKLMTWGALVFEFFGPLILFVPLVLPFVRNSLIRYIAVISFIFLHITFGLAFSIGIFPFVSICIWLAFLPQEFWQGLGRKIQTPQRQGLIINYDADCGFCKKMVLFLKTFLILPNTTIRQAQENPEIYADMVANNSWVVEDWQGNRRFKWQAMAYLFSLSPVFFPLAKVLRLPPLMSIGNKIYEFVASHRRLAGKFTAPFKYRPLEVNNSTFLTSLALLLFILASLSNIRGFFNAFYWRPDLKKAWMEQPYQAFNRKIFHQIEPLAQLTKLDQGWGIFAPGPPRDDGWYVIQGTLEDGTEVDLLRGTKGPLNWEKPTMAERNRLYKNMQWRSFFIILNRARGEVLYPYYGEYLCREWNNNHPKQKVRQVRIYFMDEATVPPGELQPPAQKTLAWENTCSD